MDPIFEFTLFVAAPDEEHTRPFKEAAIRAEAQVNAILRAGKHRARLQVLKDEDLGADFYPEGIQAAIDQQVGVEQHDFVVGIFGLK